MSCDKLHYYIKNKQYFEIGRVLCNIYLEEPNNFYSRVMLYGKLPDPTKHDFDKHKEVVETLEKSIPEMVKYCNDNGVSSSTLEAECYNLLKIISNIRKNFNNNISQLLQCQFFQLPRGAQIQTILAHIEGIHLALEGRLEKNQFESGALTGLEREVASLPGLDGRDSFSMIDVQEILVEYADDLIRYISYLNTNAKITEGFIENVNPKEVLGYFEALKLAQSNFLLNSTWEHVKYRNWHLGEFSAEGKHILSIEPLNLDAFKVERASTLRYSYKYFSELPKLYARSGERLDRSKKQIDILGEFIKHKGVNALFKII